MGIRVKLAIEKTKSLFLLWVILNQIKGRKESLETVFKWIEYTYKEGAKYQ